MCFAQNNHPTPWVRQTRVTNGGEGSERWLKRTLVEDERSENRQTRTAQRKIGIKWREKNGTQYQYNEETETKAGVD